LQLQYFLAFQNPARKQKDPFVIPSTQMSAQILNQGRTFGATERKKIKKIKIKSCIK